MDPETNRTFETITALIKENYPKLLDARQNIKAGLSKFRKDIENAEIRLRTMQKKYHDAERQISNLSCARLPKRIKEAGAIAVTEIARMQKAITENKNLENELKNDYAKLTGHLEHAVVEILNQARSQLVGEFDPVAWSWILRKIELEFYVDLSQFENMGELL